MHFGSGARTRFVGLTLALAAVAARPTAESAGPVLTRGAGACHAVAFTFDLCPVRSGAGFDAALVKFLEEHRVHATFFASGKWMATHDAELRRLIAHPFFEIGTHGQTHAHMRTLTPDAQSAEMRGAIALLEDRFGVHTQLFRPPYGEYNDDTLRVAEAAGQTVVMWSVVSGDPDPKLSASSITDDVVSRARNGSIVVFHANGRGWRTSEVLPAIYQRLVVAKGFGTDTISELRGCAGVPVTLVPDQSYSGHHGRQP